ncbi:MAG: LapD/MoxY N-terminal periplasmic domain-containing protein [Sulfurimonas sp.]|uniref:LapD/MoxY N-terminal periplasmic domain-containing protein n=1 Tax=Sulfurimonas sp. TaxID=2022749 RepID=UPI0028CD2904|nr:LapD/MoxY N-terminal periplasmic domain-containing protein [Sulfurimonas sp.]MDT8338398.1 LapD/MoxY N-terminal periplasmic domain-containing protein [Sulfurimonas sp.]
MTLYKQTALLLSLFLLTILTTVLVLNFQSVNRGVEERLYEDAKNTATSLSLSLGGANGDLSMMSTMINANFDSGNYRKITLVDVENNPLYERVIESDIVVVPRWFTKLVSLRAPVAFANVSAGWSQVGILHIQSDSTYAYKQLYSILMDLLISFAIIAALSLTVLNLLLHAILRPLKEVQKQATAITKNEFIIQENIPYTKELSDVVLGMNNMVSKVKAMFDKGNEELKAHKELEYTDENTQLRNRKYLIDRLPAYLKVDASYESGVNMIVAFNGINEANERIGHQQVDKLFVAIAEIFRKSTRDINESIVARINGTEFSIFLPGYTGSDAIGLAKSIQKSCFNAIDSAGLNQHETFVCIGIYEYNHKNSISELFSRSDNALAQAKFNHEHIHLEKTDTAVEVMGKVAWKLLINKAIEKSRFSFVSWAVVDIKNMKTVHHVLSINLILDKNSSYSYAQFMAPAIQSGLSCDIYKKIVTMLFNDSVSLLGASTYSLRLPQEYLQKQETYHDISELLRANASMLAFKLIIELPDRLVRQDSKNIREYIELFRRYSIDIGIFEFIGESEDYQYLKELRPSYIKAQSSYFLTQSDQSISALRLITDSIGISLIAVGVSDMETLEMLREKGISIVQGKVTETLELD